MREIRSRRRFGMLAAAAVIAAATFFSAPVQAESASELEAAARATLERLKATEPVSDAMLESAKGVLVFPEIIKAGLMVGGATGKGVLLVDGKPAGFYRSTALSYGLQAGVTKFGYVVVLMDDAAMKFLDDSNGWEIGSAPNVTIADEGLAGRLSSSTVQEGIYVFFVDQEGFFAGLGLEGAKISKIAE